MTRRWEVIFTKLQELDSIRNQNIDTPLNAKHMMYMSKTDELHDEMSEMEKEFGDLDFNNSMDEFINEQKSLRADLFTKVMSKGNEIAIFTFLMGLLIPLTLLLGSGYLLFGKENCQGN